MARIDQKLAGLDVLSQGELRLAWQDLHGSAAPAVAPPLLRMGLAYALQSKAHGGLKASTLRALAQAADGSPTPAIIPPMLRPGTQLVRTWQGRTLTVTVEDSGFRFEGRTYPSLTTIACEVTGSRRSGPRFFGLLDGRAR